MTIGVLASVERPGFQVAEGVVVHAINFCTELRGPPFGPPSCMGTGVTLFEPLVKRNDITKRNKSRNVQICDVVGKSRNASRPQHTQNITYCFEIFFGTDLTCIPLSIHLGCGGSLPPVTMIFLKRAGSFTSFDISRWITPGHPSACATADTRCPPTSIESTCPSKHTMASMGQASSSMTLRGCRRKRRAYSKSIWQRGRALNARARASISGLVPEAHVGLKRWGNHCRSIHHRSVFVEWRDHEGNRTVLFPICGRF